MRGMELMIALMPLYSLAEEEQTQAEPEPTVEAKETPAEAEATPEGPRPGCQWWLATSVCGRRSEHWWRGATSGTRKGSVEKKMDWRG